MILTFKCISLATNRDTPFQNKVIGKFSKRTLKHFGDFRCELLINKHKAGLHIHVYNDAYLWNIDTLFKFCVFREMYQVCTY